MIMNNNNNNKFGGWFPGIKKKAVAQLLTLSRFSVEQSFLNTNFSSIKSGNINAAFWVSVSIISQKSQV